MKNQYILDNVVLGQELIHHCKSWQEEGLVIKIDFEKAYDKIHWDHLIEILTSRGLGNKWIRLIKDWLNSSQSCMSFNGELTPYFYYKRGVRQGDPLSPFLFILAADTLSKIFHKGRQTDTLVGIGSPCLEGKQITNCHYVDDTILFLKATHRNVRSIRMVSHDWFWGLIRHQNEPT